MSDFEIGTVTLTQVNGFTPFTRPLDRQVVHLISDGVTTDNDVIQQSAPANRRAEVRGRTQDAAVIAALQSYYEGLDLVTFVDCDNVSSTVRVLELTVEREFLGWQTYSMTLFQVS